MVAGCFACTRRDADGEPPPPPRITTPTRTNLPHPHEWAPPQKRFVHYIDLTRPPTPHQQMRLISRNKPVSSSVQGYGPPTQVSHERSQKRLAEGSMASGKKHAGRAPSPAPLVVGGPRATCVVERIDVELIGVREELSLKGGVKRRLGQPGRRASAVESRPSKQRILHRLASELRWRRSTRFDWTSRGPGRGGTNVRVAWAYF